MDTLLVKIFATALTFSQVATAPDRLKTEFDPISDRQQVIDLLRAGCAQMRKAFDIEDLNVDDLIATAMDDPEALAGGHAAFRGINIKDLHVAYRQFCKNEAIANSPVDVGEVIEFYNRTLADLPDHARLKGRRLPGMSVVLDLKGERFVELHEPDQRRLWVNLADVPLHVRQAFVAAEDKRFYQHKGIDERALIRAFIGNLAQSGRPQGGSTITQQTVKNLLVGEDVTYQRKMREMVLAARLEQALTKDEILELYLNSTYLGRASWGIGMAARSYFGKTVQSLSVAEGALLAALTKGPNYFNPDRHPDRAKERFAYVVGRMREDGAIGSDEAKRLSALPQLVAFDRPRRNTGFHFVDFLAREVKAAAGLDGLTADSYTVRSTIHPALQRATESALQEGLALYEIGTGRVLFQAPEANLADAIGRIEAEQRPGKPAWQQALERARLPLYDVHWPAAVIIEKAATRGGGETVRVGLADGRILPLSVGRASILRNLKLHDVVLVRVVSAKGKNTRAELRVRPTVQGAAVVLENNTGRILALAGSFSYPLSQLNRATQSQRQPGSALKPLTFLAALQNGLQPNTYVRDEPITLPPISGNVNARHEDYWSPKNYDGSSSGITTLRNALENSKNLATVNLLEGGVDATPALSLDRICALALEAQIYRECVRYYPFVLGAQPVRPIDLAAFYAAIANEGMRPEPYAIESIEHRGRVIYRHEPVLTVIGSVDRVSFYQLKTMLQGVLQRGTARGIAHFAPYVAGKTGTTDGENDAWFVGFTNDVTVAVWVGYDNADGRRRTLGSGQTGASVAIPVFRPIMEAVWAHHAPKVALGPPSPEARRYLVARRIDLDSGGADPAAPAKAMVEYFRRDRRGNASDTQYQLVSRGEVEAAYEPRDGTAFEPWAPWGGRRWDAEPAPRPPPWGGFFGWRQPQPPPPRYDDPRNRQRYRADPNVPRY